MRSATSYFNGTLYRKTMARFWPLWGLWAFGWLFLLPLNMLNRWLNYARQMDPHMLRYMLDEAKNLPDLLSAGVYLALFFAVLCAMAVFGYLYNSRSACWTHALPLRREALFTTQYLAGLSFLLLPLLAAGGLTAMVELSILPMEDWGNALSALLAWLLAQCGICLFFFSFASFCAMFTGNILALPAFYFILNFLAAGVWYLVESLLREFYYGYNGTPGAAEAVEYLTPSYALSRAVRYGYGEAGNRLNSPGTAAAYAAVGVALALISLYVYRRRHVETAGDVVSVALVRPLFKYGVSFCAGLAFGMFTAAFFGWSELPALIPCIVVWSVIGYFAAEMLLRKSFRVLKAWKGAAVMAAVVLLLCLGCLADVFGIVNRVPDAARVESVQVNIEIGAPYDSGRTLNATLTDPAQIEKITALHRAIVSNRNNRNGHSYGSDSDYTFAYLTYTLKGGGELNRRYTGLPVSAGELNTPGTVTYAMKQILDDRALVARAYNFEGFMKNSRLTDAYLDGLFLNGELHGLYVHVDDFRRELWDAVQQDFAEGTIGVRYLFDNSKERRENTYRADLVFEVTRDPNAKGPAGYEDGSYPRETAPSAYPTQALHITLTPQARHTLAVLDKAGIFAEGYTLERDDAQGGGTETVEY